MRVSNCLVSETVLVITVKSCFGWTASCHQGRWACSDVQCTIESPRHCTAFVQGIATDIGKLQPIPFDELVEACGCALRYSIRVRRDRKAGRGLVTSANVGAAAAM